MHQGRGEREVMRDVEPNEERCAGDATTGSPVSVVAPTLAVAPAAGGGAVEFLGGAS